jgi:4-oxalocrotonate tautomerase
MPHVIVKLYAGRSEPQKARLAEEITRTVINTLGYGEEAVSVSIEDVEPMDWPETVYKPDILDKPAQLYKKPGYNPFK